MDVQSVRLALVGIKAGTIVKLTLASQENAVGAETLDGLANLQLFLLHGALSDADEPTYEKVGRLSPLLPTMDSATRTMRFRVEEAFGSEFFTPMLAKYLEAIEIGEEPSARRSMQREIHANDASPDRFS